MYSLLIQPFAEHDYMRMALAACFAISLGSAPLGVFLVLRRMTLVGDAMQHAILPGAAIAFLIAGHSFWLMISGGLVAGLLIVLIAVLINRYTHLTEDSSFTGVYLIALALGVAVFSHEHDAEELMHSLFGDVMEIKSDSLLFITTIATISLMALSLIYRGLVTECFDSGFMKSVKGRGGLYHAIFLVLIVLNLVAAYQALGTIMSFGQMILPAIVARFWTNEIDKTFFISIAVSAVSSVIGLLISYHLKISASPAIVLTVGCLYIFSILFGANGGVVFKLMKLRHYKA